MDFADSFVLKCFTKKLNCPGQRENLRFQSLIGRIQIIQLLQIWSEPFVFTLYISAKPGSFVNLCAGEITHRFSVR